MVSKAPDRPEIGSCMVLVADLELSTVSVYRSRTEIRVLAAEAGDAVDDEDVASGGRLLIVELFA